MTKEEIISILTSLASLETGQADMKLQFSNHLEHHRADAIRDMTRLRKWIWVCIPTIAMLIVVLVAAAFALGKNLPDLV